jgi:hypothetical protein
VNTTSGAKRQAMRQLRRRVLLWLLLRGRPARKTDVARALGIDWGEYPVVLDHWWFRHRDCRVWLSEDGARELSGNVRREYAEKNEAEVHP